VTLPLIPLGLMGRTGTRNFPVLRSTSNDNPGTFSQSHTIDLPSGTQAGDLLIMLLVARATVAGLTDVTMSGWTRLGSPPLLSAQAFYRIAPSAITTASISTPSINTSITSNGYCFSSYSELPAIEWANGTGETPNPPLLTVPAEWGSKPHCMYIASMHLFGNVLATNTPANYGNLITSVSSNNNRTYSERRLLRATSDNPTAYVIDGTNPDLQSWATATIAVRGT
jgi:hypothetical protein